MNELNPWPRLLASWDGRSLSTVRQQCDGRRVFARQCELTDASLLARGLAAGMGSGARRPRHAALILSRPQELGNADSLRHSLGLQTLLLLPHETLPEDGLEIAARTLAQHWRKQAREEAADLIDRARGIYPCLSRSERRMADLLLADAGAVLQSPTAQLAVDAGISQPQVIRFCRSLGLEGVKEMRRELAACLALRGR